MEEFLLENLYTCHSDQEFYECLKTNFSKVLQSHTESAAADQAGEMYDIHDSPAWKTAYSDSEIFKGDKRGISLALCTDGVNPFSHAHVKYSMWPIMVTILNLPRQIRNLFGSVLLLGIIPGNNNLEPKSLDPYLQVVTDELLQLNGKKSMMHIRILRLS